MRDRVRVALLLVLGGCGDPSSLLLSVSRGADTPAPGELRVVAYGCGSLGAATLPLGGHHTLPGTVLLSPIDASAPNFRLLVNGTLNASRTVAQSVARVAPKRGARTTLSVELGPLLPDSDGDGVPDAIDDCPSVPDPDQRCDCGPRDLAVADVGSADGADLLASDLAPSDFAASGCPLTALFCEDFESGAPSWQIGATPAGVNACGLDSVLPFRGGRSLHAVAVNAATMGDAVALRSLTPATRVALRAHVYSTASPGPYGFVVAFYSGSNAISAGRHNDTTGEWMLSEYLGATINDSFSSATFTPGRWMCVELVIVPVGPGQHAQLYLDGAMLIDATLVSVKSYDTVAVGLPRISSGVNDDVFVDDVVVASDRIGCP